MTIYRRPCKTKIKQKLLNWLFTVNFLQLQDQSRRIPTVAKRASWKDDGYMGSLSLCSDNNWDDFPVLPGFTWCDALFSFSPLWCCTVFQRGDRTHPCPKPHASPVVIGIRREEDGRGRNLWRIVYTRFRPPYLAVGRWFSSSVFFQHSLPEKDNAFFQQ